MDDNYAEPLHFEDAAGGSFEPEPETESLDPAPEQRGQPLPGTFLRQLARRVQEVAAERGLHPRTETRGRLAKFWYGRNGSIHYEIWLHERTMLIEIGLHCESSAEHNALLYRALDRHMLEIQAELGTAFWLEEWDHGWVRLYETHPMRPLGIPRIEELAERTVEIMAVLEPIYRSVASRLPAPPESTPPRHSARPAWQH